ALESTRDMPRQIIECIADAVFPQLAPTAVELDNKISLGVGCVDTLDHFGGDLTAMVEDAVSVQRVKPAVGAVGQHSQLRTGLILRFAGIIRVAPGYPGVDVW